MSGAVEIQGRCDEGFDGVADAFRENFDRRDELGAAFCLYVDGVARVDLWGGTADARTGRPWDEHTLALVFSTTKGITAMCIALLVDRGLLALDDPVSRHWPEFAANGKTTVTVAQLMSHQAGLVAVEAPIDLDAILTVAPVVESLQAQAPEWRPGTAHGYHALTYGWLAGELLARVDGRRIGQFLLDEVAEPLGAEFWIGLPDAERDRVARLRNAPMSTDPAALDRMLRAFGPGTNGYRALFLDGRMSMAGDNDYNSPAVWASEMPAVNGITNARSLARIYAAMIGEVDGVRLLSSGAVDATRTELVCGHDMTLLEPTRFGAGFWLHHVGTPMIQDGSFGHPGAGGSLGYANPELGIGYGYVMNQMGRGVTGDPRTIALNDAVLAAVT